jgi:dnd system-associated protein 4
MSVVDPRVRRPERHEVLIQQLRNDAGFPAFRDVLLFAAGVGFAQGRRVPFGRSAEPIRYEILTNDALAEPFVSMLAAVTSEGDPEILDAARLPERIVIFEEYANGGLEYIQEQLNTRREPLDVMVRSLTVEGVADAGEVRGATIEELLDAY